MKRSKEELLKIVSDFIGETNTDDALSLLDDISDTIDNGSEDWEQKYYDNDKAWRERYKARFSETKTEEREETEETEENEGANPLTYENLFEEVKEK